MNEAQKAERQRLRALIRDYCSTEQCGRGCASCPVNKAQACGVPVGSHEIPVANLCEAEKIILKEREAKT